MAPPHRLRDNALIDALEKITPVPFDGTAWRVVKTPRL
jgi:hypothetical protein